jgi:hypothetical protein
MQHAVRGGSTAPAARIEDEARTAAMTKEAEAPGQQRRRLRELGLRTTSGFADCRPGERLSRSYAPRYRTDLEEWRSKKELSF